VTATTEQAALDAGRHDIAWLRRALQTAVELEHATLPLYASAMLCLEVQNYVTYNAIRSVLMEEMVHMGIAANMLAAIGGTPRIASLDPHYPRRGFPGGAESDLELVLASLSNRQLESFMRLESPQFLLGKPYRDERYPTIGRFYQAIRAAIQGSAEQVRDAFQAGGPANQVGDNIGFTTFTSARGTDPVEMLCAGIDEILEQGEGTGSGSIEADAIYQHEESHYAKFAELRHGRRYSGPPAGTVVTARNVDRCFAGEAIDWPVVMNTLAVPSDGYQAVLAEDPAGADAEKELAVFDAAYTKVLVGLDELWNGPMDTQWATFGQAVTGMMELRVTSCFTFMRRQIPPAVIARLPELYPADFDLLASRTDLSRPVFYGPRFSVTVAGGLPRTNSGCGAPRARRSDGNSTSSWTPLAGTLCGTSSATS
jgi:hypothetical protein